MASSASSQGGSAANVTIGPLSPWQKLTQIHFPASGNFTGELTIVMNMEMGDPSPAGTVDLGNGIVVDTQTGGSAGQESTAFLYVGDFTKAQGGVASVDIAWSNFSSITYKNSGVLDLVEVAPGLWFFVITKGNPVIINGPANPGAPTIIDQPVDLALVDANNSFQLLLAFHTNDIDVITYLRAIDVTATLRTTTTVGKKVTTGTKKMAYSADNNTEPNFPVFDFPSPAELSKLDDLGPGQDFWAIYPVDINYAANTISFGACVLQINGPKGVG